MNEDDADEYFKEAALRNLIQRLDQDITIYEQSVNFWTVKAQDAIKYSCNKSENIQEASYAEGRLQECKRILALLKGKIK